MTVAIRSVLAFVAALTLAETAARQAHALDGYWNGVLSDFWGDGFNGEDSNWRSSFPPSGSPVEVPDDTAIFSPTAQNKTALVQSARSIRTLIYTTGDKKFDIRVNNGGSLPVKGLGITNASDVPQTIVVEDSSSRLRLMDRAVACKQPHASFEIVNKDGGTTTFENKATGKRMCEIINEAKGNIEFFDRSSGGKLYLTNTKNSSRIAFLNRSTPGDAQIGNFKGKFTCDTVGPNKDLKISAGKVFNNARFDLGLCKLKIAKRLETDTASKISISFQGSKLFGSIQAGKGAFLDGLLVVMGNKKVRPGRYVLIKSNAGVSNGFSATRLLGFSLALDVKVVRKANKVELVLTEK